MASFIICDDCQQTNDVSAKVCHLCGAALTVTPPPPETVSSFVAENQEATPNNSPQIEPLETALAEEKARISILEAELQAARQQNAASNARLAELQSQLEIANHQMNEQHIQDIQKHVDIIQTLEKEKLKLEKDFDEEKSNVFLLQTQLKEAQQLVSGYDSQISALQNQLNAANKKDEPHLKAIEKLEKDKAKLDKSLGESWAKVSQLETDLVKLDVDNKKKIAELQNQLNAANKKVEQHSKTIQSLEKDKAGLSKSLGEAQAKVSQLETDLVKLDVDNKKKTAELQNQLNAANQKVEQQRKTLQSIEKDKADLFFKNEAELKTAYEKIGQYINIIENFEKDKTELNKSLDEAKSRSIDQIVFIGCIPELNALVTEIKFFESDFNPPPLGEREYSVKFSKNFSRYIYWEINLAYPKHNEKVDFQIKFIYKINEKVITRDKDAFTQTCILPDWTESVHTSGWGWSDAGKWDRRKYTVELFVGENKIAQGKFLIK